VPLNHPELARMSLVSFSGFRRSRLRIPIASLYVAIALIAHTRTKRNFLSGCETRSQQLSQRHKVSDAEMASHNITRAAFHPENNYKKSSRNQTLCKINDGFGRLGSDGEDAAYFRAIEKSPPRTEGLWKACYLRSLMPRTVTHAGADRGSPFISKLEMPEGASSGGWQPPLEPSKPGS
jgi:hypothetical protein